MAYLFNNVTKSRTIPQSREHETPETVVIRSPNLFFFKMCVHSFIFVSFYQANLKEVYLIILLRQPENLLLKRSRECIISDTNLEITLIMS